MVRKRKCLLCGNAKKLHNFPKNRARVKMWLIKIGKKKIMTEPDYIRRLQNWYLCTNHFADWCYTSTERKNLIHFAEPCTLNPPRGLESETFESESTLEVEVVEDLVLTTEKEKDILLKKLLKKNFTARQYQLILSQIRSLEPGKCFSADDEIIALSIYLQSPSTYRLLRKYLNFPSLSSLNIY